MSKRSYVVLSAICIPSLMAWADISNAASIKHWTYVGGYQGDSSIHDFIEGQDTHFVQGRTQIDFGPGIQIQSAKVYSPTTVDVAIRIDRFAPLGAHPITIVTGDERIPGPVFTVSALVTPLGANPDALTLHVPAKVVLTTRVAHLKELLVASVRVERVDKNEHVLSVLGELHDDGVSPDLVAGDYVFSGVLPMQEDQIETIKLRASVSFVGQNQPSVSQSIPIEILSSDVPSAYKPQGEFKTVRDPTTGNEIVANEVLVAFVENTPSELIARDAKLVNGRLTGRLMKGTYVIVLPDDPTGKNVDAAIAVLRIKPEVKYAEADGVMTTQ